MTDFVFLFYKKIDNELILVIGFILEVNPRNNKYCLKNIFRTTKIKRVKVNETDLS